MIYLCSPFSHSDPAVRERRFQTACRAAAELFRQGKTVFSPIVYTHSIAANGLPLDWAFWRQLDIEFLAICTEVVVLKLDGWQASEGVQAEIAMARALGKSVTFLSMPTDSEAKPEPSRS